ncbi:MAG: helix-turn-helix transcriptional regulator [Elusimicrobiota bacterium]
MNIKKYFWGYNEKAIKETVKILKNPTHPKFLARLFTLLSRLHKPRELFSIISKEQFIEVWPKMRKYWVKTSQTKDFLYWWETIYEQLLKIKKRPEGSPMIGLQFIGEIIKNTRIKKGWNQSDFAKRVRMKQPDISEIEQGKKNITLQTLIKLCKILGIKNIPIK